MTKDVHLNKRVLFMLSQKRKRRLLSADEIPNISTSAVQEIFFPPVEETFDSSVCQTGAEFLLHLQSIQ